MRAYDPAPDPATTIGAVLPDTLRVLGWRDYHFLEAIEVVERLPVADREPALALVSEPGIPPRTAIEILRKLAKRKPAERREIYRLAASEDPRERSLAKTRAAELPPMPDPRLASLDDMRRRCRRMLSLYPADPFAAETQELLVRIEALRSAIAVAYRALRDREAAELSEAHP
ncbi:MAG: hypothetical protein OZ948_19630 [Deltaproteobacteria bacterium]|nr:hypothetical protein [Deltaproteobacteria bacterium]